MNMVKGKVINLLLWCGCLTIIQAVWETIEIACYGMAVPSLEDTVIGVLFATVLWRAVLDWAKEA